MNTIPIKATGHRYELEAGAGYNWFDYLGRGGCYADATSYDLSDVVYPALDDAPSWRALEGELSHLRPGIIRFGLPPDPHLDNEGRLVTNTPHIERLRRVCRWAAAHGCTVMVDTFLLTKRHAAPRPPVDPAHMVQMGATDNRAYAREFVAPLLKFLASDPEFGVVRWFNPVNEPMCYGIYQTPAEGPEVWAHYVEMYREMRLALDEAGVLRTRIGLAAIDHTSPSPMTMLELMDRSPDIDPYVDGYTIHYYYLRFDHYVSRPEIDHSAPLEDAMDRQTAALVRACKRRGKPLLATEIGTFYNGQRRGDPAGVASLDSAIIVAEGVIRGLNIGLDGFCFWSLFNPNTIDGHFALISVQGGEVKRHGWTWPIYSRLTRHVRPGSQVIALASREWGDPLPHLHAVALKQDERRVVLVVNDHASETREALFELPADFGTCPPCLHTVGEHGPARLSTDGRTLTVPPLSFVLLTDQPEVV